MADYLPWLRAQVGRALLPLAYATTIVQDDAGRVLFQRRADFGDAWWGLPGGLLDPGERPEACARRELLEETGLTVGPLRLTGVYSSARYAVTYPNGDQVQQITFCYAGRLAGGRPQPQTSEIAELAFFAADALPPRPIWYADMLAHALAGRSAPYFDPPAYTSLSTPYPTFMDLRRVVGNAPLICPGASAAVLDEAGRLLLQRRADNGFWAMPAGALDTGETLAHAARRETREETGLVVEPVRVLAVYGGHEIVLPNGHCLFPTGALFGCRRVGGELRADGRESTAVRYFAQDELPPMLPHDRERVAAAFAAGPLLAAR